MTNGLVLRPQMLAAGYSDDELRRMRSGRQLVAVRPGAYVASDDERLRSPAARHLLAIEAALQQLGPGAVVSHASAAVVHRLPLWDTPLDRVHVTRNRRSGGRRSRYLHLHTASLDADEVELVGGILVTSVPRTIADLAVPTGSPARISTAQLPAGRTGEPAEYARYEAGSPAHPAETWIRRYTHRTSGRNR